MKQTRKVQPCGMLYSQGREYFVLRPAPIPGDSWEGDNAYRWLVVPNKEISRVKHHYENGSFDWVTMYSFARHIVSTAFVVDYAAGMPEIYVEIEDEVDVSKTEWKEKNQLNTLADWYPEMPTTSQSYCNNLFTQEERA